MSNQDNSVATEYGSLTIVGLISFLEHYRP